MYSITINPLLNYVKPLFQERVLTLIQKKVAAVALLILTCIIGYTFYQICFKANDQRIKPLIEDISNPQETKNLVQKEIVELNKKEDQGQEDIDELKIYPLLISNKDELNNWVDITFKNVSCLEDARIILMGETHTAVEHLEIEHYIIHRFGQNNDIVLIENAEGKIKRSTTYGHMMDIYGWDNVRLSHKGKLMIKKINEVLQQQKLSTDPILSQELNKKAGQLFKKYIYFVHKRNEALIKNINNLLLKFPDKKFFLIAGQLHLIEDTYNILNYLPKQEKCALLILKDTSSEEDALAYMESLVNSSNESEVVS